MLYKDEDVEAWYSYPRLRWLYDKLQLSIKLGYECGPAGTLPSQPGQWFVKPQINLMGMGVGSYRYNGSPVPAGYFWMPYFEGQHLSVDLHFVGHMWCPREVLSVEYEAGRPKLWTRHALDNIDVLPPVPMWLFAALQAADANKCNIEFIGGNIIEVHLRWGHDFDAAPPEAEYAEVVWADRIDDRPYVQNYEDCLGALKVPRLGFRYY